MTDPDNLIEAVGRAAKTYQAVTVRIYGKEFFRVMSGNVAFGGDHDEFEDAEDAANLLNAKAAIFATLEGIGDDLRQLVRDTLMMALQRAEETSDSHVWIANQALEQFNDTLLASMKDETHG